MSIFDKLKSSAKQAVTTAAKSIGDKKETFTFRRFPKQALTLPSKRRLLRFLRSAPMQPTRTSEPK